MQVPYQWITDSLIGVINCLIEEGRGCYVTNVQLLVSFFSSFCLPIFLSDNLLMKGLTCFECTVARQRSFNFFPVFSLSELDLISSSHWQTGFCVPFMHCKTWPKGHRLSILEPFKEEHKPDFRVNNLHSRHTQALHSPLLKRLSCQFYDSLIIGRGLTYN